MIVPVLAGCAAGGPGRSSACACSEVAFVLVLTGALAWDGWFASADQNATWSPVLGSSPSSAQWPPRSGGLGCHDLVDGICRPAGSGEPLRSRGEPSRSRVRRGSRWPGRCARRSRFACPCRARCRAVSGARCWRQAFSAVVVRGAGGNSGLVRRRAGCEVCHGRPGRMSPGLVMAGTGGALVRRDAGWHGRQRRYHGQGSAAALRRPGGRGFDVSGGSPSRCAARALRAAGHERGREDLHDGGAGGTRPAGPGHCPGAGLRPLPRASPIRDRWGSCCRRAGSRRI